MCVCCSNAYCCLFGKILGHLGEYPEAMECLHLAMSLALVDPLAQGDAAEESGREYGAFGQTGTMIKPYSHHLSSVGSVVCVCHYMFMK